jgi:hypothetical protein
LFPPLDARQCLPQCRPDVGIAFGKRSPRNFHQLEELRGDAAHQSVLGLVGPAVGTPAPAADEQQWDPKNVGQRGERIDRIAKARILHQRAAVDSTQLGAAGDRHRIALVGRIYPSKVAALGHGGEKRREIRAGDPGEESESGQLQ